jgi:dihydrofolate reductase
MIINHIVAKAQNNAIGKDNQLIWHLSNDLKFFRKVTTGHYLITGRKNYESIGRVLPNRIMIIVTRDKNFSAEGSIVVNSIAEAFDYLKNKNVAECFVIGGGEIYKETLDLTDKIFLTEVNCSPDADVFYPTLDENDWEVLLQESHQKDEKNPFDYTFKLLKRKKNSLA